MHLPRWTKFALIASLLCTQLACQNTKPDAPSSDATAITQQAPESEAISEKEAIEFADKIVAGIASGDLASLDGTFDYDIFLDRAFGGLDIPEREFDGIRSGFKGELEKKPGGFFQEFATGKLKVLRFHQDGDTPKALLRLLDANSGAVSYLEFFLTKDKSGKVMVYDIHSYATGEPVSQTVRRLVLPMVSQLTKTPLQKLVNGGGQDEMKHFEDMVQVMQLRKTGQFAEAAKIYEGLPKELQDSKPMLIAYVSTTMEMDDDDKYLKALERFRTKYADDPAMLLHSIDYYFLKKDYPKMMATLDEIEKSLGVEDPYLDVMRASGQMEKKDFGKAAEFCREAIKAEPMLEEAYWMLATAGLEGKDNKAVLEALNGLKEHFPGAVAPLDGVPDYADFLKSPEGKEWMSQNS